MSGARLFAAVVVALVVWQSSSLAQNQPADKLEEGSKWSGFYKSRTKRNFRFDATLEVTKRKGDMFEAKQTNPDGAVITYKGTIKDGDIQARIADITGAPPGGPPKEQLKQQVRITGRLTKSALKLMYTHKEQNEIGDFSYTLD